MTEDERRELTIASVVKGMEEAFDCDSIALKQLALSTGAMALKSLAREFFMMNRQHSQMAKVLSDDDGDQD